MRDTSLPEPAAAWLGSRLKHANGALAARWLEGLVHLPAISAPDGASGKLLAHLPELISELADHLRGPETEDIGRNRSVMRQATQLGELRFEQRASIHQLLRDYQILSDLLEDFLLHEVEQVDPPLAADDVVRVMSRVTHAVRTLQRQTIDTFISKYTATIERQNTQLLAFGRTVANEIRKPLGVLQLMSSLMPVPTGDTESTYLVDVLDRNVRRLADVATRLERLAHSELEIDVVPDEQTVNLTALVDQVVKGLRQAATARGVRCVVDSELPLLDVEPARTELVFLNLIANAIKHSDPAKSSRVVEILSVAGVPQPTVLVRDNGVGMSPRRVQHLFREFDRTHDYRDRDLDGQGLGLGLSIVRECMDACGGTVRIESTEGEGTTVTLTWRT